MRRQKLAEDVRSLSIYEQRLGVDDQENTSESEDLQFRLFLAAVANMSVLQSIRLHDVYITRKSTEDLVKQFEVHGVSLRNVEIHLIRTFKPDSGPGLKYQLLPLPGLASLVSNVFDEESYCEERKCPEKVVKN
jgi:hypothetical protein